MDNGPVYSVGIASRFPIDSPGKLQDKADNLSQNVSEIKQSIQGFRKIVNGQKQLANQLQDATNGIADLKKNLNQLAAAQQKAINNIPQIENGLNKQESGQKKLKKGVSDMVDQLSDLTDGLGDSVKGLNKVFGGLGDARDYVKNLSESNSEFSGYYIPAKALKSKDFKQGLDNYMSDNRKFTTMDVVLKDNPYSTKAIDQINDIHDALDRAKKDTPLENVKVGVGGTTSMYHDLKDVSNDDYTRTVVLMFIGIGLILVALLRSFIMPMYILLSLIVTYYTSMSITEFIFIDWLGYSGLNWAIPFFGFIMLVALGVDYSIFLMDRFNENRHLSIREGMLGAMRNMGTVIISATIILSGTFAEMMPSGVTELLEIATIIIIGLIVYNVLILPLFLPVMANMFGKANWWPFLRGNREE